MIRGVPGLSGRLLCQVSRCTAVGLANHHAATSLLCAADGGRWEEYHRAGAHADWDFLTLLFQKEGQVGLEICPGRESVTEFGIGDRWTKLEAKTGEIVWNIGDLLMSCPIIGSSRCFTASRRRVDPGVILGTGTNCVL